MRSEAILFTALLGIFIVASAQTVHAAQLEAVINPNVETSKFKITYQKTVSITHETGEVAGILSGQSTTLEATSSTPSPDVIALRNALNQKIASDGSATQISDLSVDYSATITGRDTRTSIDYRLVLEGTLANYNIASSGGVTGQSLVDMGWRGLSLQGPISIDGVEINIPISAIEQSAPQVYELMRGSTAEALLSEPLMNAEGIKNQPLGNWHFLFDPTGIGSDSGTFGLSEEIKGFVVSGFTMGESSIREGRQVEIEFEAEFTSDTTYHVKTVQSPDIANVQVVGFAVRDSLGDLEIFGVTAQAPEGYGTTSTGDFPVAIIYGMAGLAAVGGGAFFIFSNRQLKKEAGQGQTGIDPSRLTGYQTSASSGGYQTNRGEAQLTDAADYNQTRSVYDDSSNSQQAPPPQTQAPPALTTDSDAACGCAVSADSGNECDCEMQGQCFCDGTCQCNTTICKDTVKEMQ